MLPLRARGCQADEGPTKAGRRRIVRPGAPITETGDPFSESLFIATRPPGALTPVPESPTPALAQPLFSRPFWPLMGMAVVAAAFLVAHSLLHATAVDELLLVLVALTALVAGHGLMRNRARRVAAEHEAARVREELALQARVGDCEQRRQSLAAFAKLASHVAHEVRNPLSSIMLNTELLEEEAAKCGCESASEAAALIASIKKEAERLQHLTDEYLAFARPPRPAAAHQSLNAVAEELAHLVREEAPALRHHRRNAAVARLPVRAHRPAPDQAGRAEPRPERDAGDARRRPADDRDRRRGRRDRDAERGRHRPRDPRGTPVPDLRAVLHEQAGRARDSACRSPRTSSATTTARLISARRPAAAPGSPSRCPPSRAESGPCACSPRRPRRLEVVTR